VRCQKRKLCTGKGRRGPGGNEGLLAEEAPTVPGIARAWAELEFVIAGLTISRLAKMVV
jgi:hypothetical protein